MTDIQRTRLAEDNPVFGGNKVFELFKYSPAVKGAGLLFIAGQVGIRPDGTIPETAVEQADCAFQRLSEILRHEGLDFSNLADLVTYHVDIDSHLTGFREIKDRYIRQDFPAWTILGVAALARPNLLVEIKGVAVCR